MNGNLFFIQSLCMKGWKIILLLVCCFLLYQPRILSMLSISIPPPLSDFKLLSITVSTNSLPLVMFVCPGHGSIRSSVAQNTNTWLVHCPVCFLGLHCWDHYTVWVKYSSRCLEMFKSQCRTFTGCEISMRSLNSLCIWICSLKIMLCTNMQTGSMAVIHSWLLIEIRHHWTTIWGW